MTGLQSPVDLSSGTERAHWLAHVFASPVIKPGKPTFFKTGEGFSKVQENHRFSPSRVRMNRPLMNYAVAKDPLLCKLNTAEVGHRSSYVETSGCERVILVVPPELKQCEEPGSEETGKSV